MIRAAFIVLATFFGFSWVLGSPYAESEQWRVIAGWVLIGWALLNLPAFINGAKGWAKFFLVLLVVSIGMGVINGKWGLLETMF